MNTEQISEQAKKAADTIRTMTGVWHMWENDKIAAPIQSAITAATAEAQSRIAELEKQLEIVTKALKRADETIDQLNEAAIERGDF